MPTIRSKFTVQQFEAVLQKKACEVVSKETGIDCKIRYGKFHKVNTEDKTLEFRYREDGRCRRISFRYHKSTGKIRCCNETFSKAEHEEHIKEKHEGKSWYGWEQMDQWGFSVEPKHYLSSGHRSKISIGDENDEGKILKWIQEIMAQANIEPPRFSLKKHVAHARR